MTRITTHRSTFKSVSTPGMAVVTAGFAAFLCKRFDLKADLNGLWFEGKKDFSRGYRPGDKPILCMQVINPEERQEEADLTALQKKLQSIEAFLTRIERGFNVSIPMEFDGNTGLIRLDMSELLQKPYIMEEVPGIESRRKAVVRVAAGGLVAAGGMGLALDGLLRSGNPGEAIAGAGEAIAGMVVLTFGALLATGAFSPMGTDTDRDVFMHAVGHQLEAMRSHYVEPAQVR